MDNFSHLDPDPNPSCGSGSNSPLKIHFHLRTQVILLELLRVSEDCFPQRAGAVEIHHMHHHHILPLRLPLSVNRHGALEGDGPQPSQALVDHYPQHAARVQMRGGGGENASKIRRRLFHAGRGRLGHTTTMHQLLLLLCYHRLVLLLCVGVFSHSLTL